MALNPSKSQFHAEYRFGKSDSLCGAVRNPLETSFCWPSDLFTKHLSGEVSASGEERVWNYLELLGIARNYLELLGIARDY